MNLLEMIPVCSTVVHNGKLHSLSLQLRALPDPVEVFSSGKRFSAQFFVNVWRGIWIADLKLASVSSCLGTS